jgi:glycosyltransferase involved in cell wall biosynthesis
VLNRLNQLPGIEVFNLIDADGVGTAPAGAHQTREGIQYTIVELKGKVLHNYTDHSSRAFVGLPQLLEEIKPNIAIVSFTFFEPFIYDRRVVSKVKELGIKIIQPHTLFRVERYDVIREGILAGRRYDEYTPTYLFIILALCEKLNLNGKAIREALLKVLQFAKLYTKDAARRILLERLEEKKRMLNFADAHVNYTEKAYEILGSYGVPREKIFITYNSPDTDLLFDVRKKIEQEPPILAPNPHRLIHVGRLVPWKRVDMLIESLAALKHKFTDAELVIIGYGPQEKELKSLVKKLHLEDSVKFIGGVYDPATLGKYLLSSAVYVLAGMGGISIVDAMAFGRPIICSVCDGTEKHLVFEGYNGMYFTNGDGKDLTAKIKHLFDNPELAARMGEHSTEIIKNKINIHAVLDGYKRAFNYVLAKKD